jgi:small subunit ribosomal protein S6
MNFYELMLIFSGNLTEEEQKAQVSQVEETLKRENATIHLSDHWGKRKLAYPIKKQRQGYYDWIYVEGEPGRIAEVDRKLKMVEPLLRFMILRMEKIQIGNLQKEIARRSEASQPAAQPQAAEAQSAPETEAEQTAVIENVAEEQLSDEQASEE